MAYENEPLHMSMMTMAGRASVYHLRDDKGFKVRVLEVEGTMESATQLGERYCELVFEYTKLYDLMLRARIPLRRALMLGGGGFSYPKHAIASYPELAMDVVEIDEDVTDLAFEFFYLDRLFEEYDLEENERLRIFTADALDYLQETPDTYDAILNDCFAGGKPVAALASESCARLVKQRLTPGGVYLTNVVAALTGRKSHFLREQVAVLGRVFRHVWVVPLGADDPRTPDNNMVVACDDELDIPEAYAL